MKLIIAYDDKIADSSSLAHYEIKAVDNTRVTEKKLEKLADRIFKMGVSLLGSGFQNLYVDHEEKTITIRVQRKLLTSPRRFDLKNYIGWVAVFDVK